MADNQTCYKCNRQCNPGRGLTDEGGRRHIECPPPPDPETVARRKAAGARVGSLKRSSK